MTTLNRTLALAEVDECAVTIAQDLNLDVSRGRYVALQENSIVTKSTRGLSTSCADRVVELRGVVDDSHSFAAAAADGFNH
jgi:hypothetical protein